MTVRIRIDSRPGWAQSMPHKLGAAEVELRMHRIAAQESHNRPSADIVVRAMPLDANGDELETPSTVLHWPAAALPYWIRPDGP